MRLVFRAGTLICNIARASGRGRALNSYVSAGHRHNRLDCKRIPQRVATTMNKYCAMKIKPYNVRCYIFFHSPDDALTSRYTTQRYNLFFVLERELILQQNNPTYNPFETLRAPDYVTGFEGIEMPSELPKRYSKLVLPPGWYLPGRNKKRSHKKSHGLMAFADLSRDVAQNYKTIDKETYDFLDAVAKSLLKRSREIKARGELKSLPRKIIVPSSPNVKVAHVQASLKMSSVPVASMTVAMPNRLEQTKSISPKPVQASSPSRLDKKKPPPQPVEAVRRVSNNFEHGLETKNNVSMVAKSRPVGTMQVDPRIIETMMLPAERPRTFIMTCMPCREDPETSAGSPSPGSSVCSRSSSLSSLTPLSVENLSTTADISDHDMIQMLMST
ncbi:hypothetical protein THAOC_35284 [Thalassiosira oceanica]|uniref:Uncharacterized protein n=1 Tax=Thalassiosira oceanica TaxID=159749 RepID=K0R3N0_THAOC|nr:hypothetical protein THAOC_35284 [Thalassiosira oceanica]|eukprot:EJK46069.1 hypothetical protein THAOC_35284 [Thalassiosira oceanica]